MNAPWLSHRERGTVFSLKLIAWLALTLGRDAARLLLYPICFYFLLFNRKAARGSRLYLARVLGRRVSWRDVFRHFHVFAATLLDRPFLFAGRHEKFSITNHGLEMVQRVIDRGRGCLMLGAHMGNFELTSTLSARRHNVAVNMLMYEDNARKFSAVLEGLGAGRQRRVLPIGSVDVLLRAKECLDRGELVGIMGDRYVSGERLVRVPFLGRMAAFPAGPIIAAGALRVPVVLFFCLYQGGNRYEQHFELFAEHIALNRRSDAEIEEWVRRYSARLEHYCRLSPYNWFNFYEFWDDSPPAAEAAAAPEPAATLRGRG